VSQNSRRTARLVIVGNEILSGKVVDSNSPFLLRHLRRLGVRCTGVSVIPDDVPSIARAVREASAAADWVFSAGGVGPTHDDCTVEGVAAAFGVPLVDDPTLLEFVKTRWGGTLWPARLRLARVPEGAVVETADDFPLVRVRNVFLFPGVPKLLQRKFLSLQEKLACERPACVAVYTLQRESEMADHLARVQVDSPGVEIGSYPRYESPDWKVMLTLEGDSADAVKEAVQRLLAGLDAARLQSVDWAYRPEDEPI
jgi:molybdenum cofactor synthesis domain-containing protein